MNNKIKMSCETDNNLNAEFSYEVSKITITTINNQLTIGAKQEEPAGN